MGRTRRRWSGLASLCVPAALLLGPSAAATPVQRFQIDQPGDFLLVGNTLAQDCRAGVPAPLVGTVGDCGGDASTSDDTGADVFWAADDPEAGTASASIGIEGEARRSSAVLALPPGATVTYARLYWSAEGPVADPTAIVEVPGSTRVEVIADATWTAARPSAPDTRFYLSSADVTGLVRDTTGTGGRTTFRVGGVDSVEFAAVVDEMGYAAWTMVVFYSDPSQPNRNLTIFDGLDVVEKNSTAKVLISGFHVPNAGFDARLGVVAYEGDSSISGDSLSFNGATISDEQNPPNNFFNGTRSRLGAAVSEPGDLPRLDGSPGSMSGVDMDVVDVRPMLAAGDTQGYVEAATVQDVYLVAVYVTSISTIEPSFQTTYKTAVDLNGGRVLPGDIIEFTIQATNTGNDPAVDVVLEDALRPGLSYVPGTIEVLAGANVGPVTDARQDDAGEYLDGSRAVQVRLGAGADRILGGRMDPGESSTVRFRAVFTGTLAGVARNQASVLARGLNGAPMQTWASDGDLDKAGSQPTDLESDTDLDGILDSTEAILGTRPDAPDSDGDGIGDWTETDGGQPVDTDRDGRIDAVDDDSDGDGIPDSVEGTGDLDGDGVPDWRDVDDDGDGVPSAFDNCPRAGNADQADRDGDGIGDACDDDADGDGTVDTRDNCPWVLNPDQADLDGDGDGDACDPDIDGDGIANETDNCPRVSNIDQADSDGDGVGDACDDTTAVDDGVPEDADDGPEVVDPSPGDAGADEPWVEASADVPASPDLWPQDSGGPEAGGIDATPTDDEGTVVEAAGRHGGGCSTPAGACPGSGSGLVEALGLMLATACVLGRRRERRKVVPEGGRS